MKFKKLGKFIFIAMSAVLLTLPVQKVFGEGSNAGFAPGNIWYSPDSFQEGDKVRIYTIVFNPDARELSGTVIFFDNNVLVGKKDFVAPPKGVKDVFMDWTATAGSHNIFGKIENAKFLISPGKYEEVYLAENETTKSSRTVDKKIVVKESDDSDPAPESALSNAGDAVAQLFENIGKKISDNTPEFVSEPVILAADTLDSLRQSAADAARDKQAEVKNEIELLNTDSSQTPEKARKFSAEAAIKPAKFTELFALALFSNVVGNKLVFYTLLSLITFLLLRYMVNRVR